MTTHPESDYKALRANNWRDLWTQIAEHMRQGWKPIGKTDLFDNELGGFDWVQILRLPANEVQL